MHFLSIIEGYGPVFVKIPMCLRKCYSTQYCLLAMLEKWKSAVDKGKFVALLIDLSKAFDCLSHELLLVKLHAYGFSIVSLRLIHSYLTLLKMGIYGAVHEWRGAKKAPLPKICHTYPAMMKFGTVIPYLKKIHKI